MHFSGNRRTHKNKNVMDTLQVDIELHTDVLIIGAGAAGLRAALALHEENLSCLIFSKRRFGDAHTWFAAGGINASLQSHDPEDRWQIHAADTLREGHFLNDSRLVEKVCRGAAEAVGELDDWGCSFSRTPSGKLDQRFFGAQSFRRTCFAGDKTGRAILDTLIDQVKASNIDVMDGIHVFHLHLIEGEVAGALAIDLATHKIVFIHTGKIVLAAGGHSSIYSRSSSRPDENIGDAAFLAYESGAELMDMEMIQFHPTGMVTPPEYVGKLVTEAVRGEGGHLLDKDRRRFMADYSPTQMELDARDEVARAIFSEIEKGNGTVNEAVYLDISHIDAKDIKERLPDMYQRFSELGIDLTKDAVEVAPTSHYSMGGIVIDPNTCSTCVAGLYAVGEATGGMHGANRLGGNSLIETVVMGKICGQAIAQANEAQYQKAPNPNKALHASLANQRFHNNPTSVIEKIKKTMWKYAGLVRTEENLEKGLSVLTSVEKSLLTDIEVIHSNRDLALNFDLNSILTTAGIVLQAAAYRRESRGAHYRSDIPESSEQWRINLICKKGENGLLIKKRTPYAPSREVEVALDENHSLNYHQLE